MLTHVERDVGQRLHATKAQADVLDVQNDIANLLVCHSCGSFVGAIKQRHAWPGTSWR
ncbi:hypothetical protein D3C72_2433280 [compost metagenome]